jgi:hypothetical protein
MKQIPLIFRMVLLIAVLALFAACSGGTFVDPGHEGGGGNDIDIPSGYVPDDDDDGTGGGGGGVSKPAQLALGATYQQALDKLDEIIKYCNAHPGTANNSMKTSAESAKSSVITMGSSGWSISGASIISGINGMISSLQ